MAPPGSLASRATTASPPDATSFHCGTETLMFVESGVPSSAGSGIWKIASRSRSESLDLSRTHAWGTATERRPPSSGSSFQPGVGSLIGAGARSSGACVSVRVSAGPLPSGDAPAAVSVGRPVEHDASSTTIAAFPVSILIRSPLDDSPPQRRFEQEGLRPRIGLWTGSRATTSVRLRRFRTGPAFRGAAAAQQRYVGWARATQVSASTFVEAGLRSHQLPRPARTDAFLAILAPVAGVLCFPVHVPRGCFGGVLGPLGSNPLHNHLSYLVPHDACVFFPEACGDDGYLSAPVFVAGTDLRFVLVEAGVDLTVSAIALLAVLAASAAWTLFGAVQGRRASQPLLWTLFTTLLSVAVLGVLWTRILLHLATTA